MQKSTSCQVCKHAFSTKDQPHGKRLPLLLLCGHTFCEGCVNILSRQHPTAIPCPTCEAETLLKHEGTVRGLAVDVYTLGLLSVGHKHNMDLLEVVDMPERSKVQSQPSQEDCVECAKRSAVYRCGQCQVLMCQQCFDQVHKSSRTLRLHRPLPLVVTPLISATHCSAHGNRIIEYFCEDDDTPICSHCYVVGPHQNHTVSDISDKNITALYALPSALVETQSVLKQLRKSRKALQSALPDLKQELQHKALSVRAHFQQLHSVLQAREMSLLQNMANVVQAQATPLQKTKSTIDDLISSMEGLMTMGQQLQQQGGGNNAYTVLQSLRSFADKPCVAQLSGDNNATPVQIDFDDELLNAIAHHGSVNGSENSQQFILESLQNAPQKVLLSALSSDTTSLPDSDTTSITSCTSSLTSLQDNKTQKQPDKTQKQSGRPRHLRQELVFVTHIRHPHHFAVQRCSQMERLKTLSRQMSKHCKTSHTIPSHLESGTMVLAQYVRDNNWYRASIEEVDNNESPPQVTVYYLDYGNKEVVALDRLRVMADRFLKLPRQALICSLIDVVPSNKEKTWSVQCAKEFAKMTEDKAMIMTVIEEVDSTLFVDLSKPPADDIKDDRPVSMRDALIFLEYAAFVSPVSAPQLFPNVVSGQQRSYLSPKVPKLKKKIEVMPVHVGRDIVVVQQISEYSQYFNQLMADMQQMYNSDTHNLLSVCCPQIGMVCACQFEHDELWYRAVIQALPGGQIVHVNYVDFGNDDIVPYTRLKKLLDKFMTLPTQSLQCELANVGIVDTEAGWPEEAREILQTMVSHPVHMQVLEVLEPNHRLLVNFHNGNVCVNQQLIEQGFVINTWSHSLSSPPLVSSSPPALQPPQPALQPSQPALQPTAQQVTATQPSEVTIPHKKVIVSHVENPGCIYIQSADSQDKMEQLKKVMEELSEGYPSHTASVEWKEGDHCSVLFENQWYRGQIVEEEQEDNTYKVQLVDFGRTIQSNMLQALDSDMLEVPPMCMCCFLADIQPAGDISRWSRTSIDFLYTKITTGSYCYVIPKGVMTDDRLVPVDLLLEVYKSGDALNADSVTMHSVSQMLRDNGLALPKLRLKQRLPTESETNTVKQEVSSSQPLSKLEVTKSEPKVNSPEPSSGPSVSSPKPEVASSKHSAGLEVTTDVQTSPPKSYKETSEPGSLEKSKLTPSEQSETSAVSDSEICPFKNSTSELIKDAERITLESPIESEITSPERDVSLSQCLSKIEVLSSESSVEPHISHSSSQSNNTSSRSSSELDNVLKSEPELPMSPSKLETVSSTPSKKTVLKMDTALSEYPSNLDGTPSALSVEVKESVSFQGPKFIVPKVSIVSSNSPKQELSSELNFVLSKSLTESESVSNKTDSQMKLSNESDAVTSTKFGESTNAQILSSAEIVSSNSIRESNADKSKLAAELAMTPSARNKSATIPSKPFAQSNEIKSKLSPVCQEFLSECMPELIEQDMPTNREWGNCNNTDTDETGSVADITENNVELFSSSLELAAAPNYPPAVLPESIHFRGVATYVDYNGVIYVQPSQNGPVPALERMVHDILLRKQKLQCGLIKPDLYCLLRCFAYLIYQDQNQYARILLELRQHLFNNWQQQYAKFTPEFSCAEFVTALESGSEGVSNDELLIYALSSLYGVYVQLYTGMAPIVLYGYGNSNLEHTVQLLYSDGHYDVLTAAQDGQLGSRTISEAATSGNCVQQLMEVLQLLFTDSKVADGRQWKIGQACVVQYTLDNLYYRAQITQLDATKAKVKYVDFGNSEEVELSRLRVPLLTDIPVQCYQCRLYRIVPVSVKWQVKHLDDLHFLVVGREAQITWVEDDVTDVSLPVSQYELSDEVTVDAAEALVEIGAATWQQWPLPERSVKSPYTALQLSSMMSVCVTQVDSPSVVYIQYSCDTTDQRVQKQLNTLVDFTEQMQSGECTQLEDVKPGCACIGRYSEDQCWYRAEILAIHHNLAAVLFVDYGSSEWMPFNRLIEIPAAMTKLPAQARRCVLAGLEQCRFSESDHIVQSLSQLLTSTPALLAELKEEDNEPIIINLYDKQQYDQMKPPLPIYTDLMQPYLNQNDDVIIEEVDEEEDRKEDKTRGE